MIDESFKNLIGGISADREQLEKRLEGASYESPKFSAESIRRMGVIIRGIREAAKGLEFEPAIAAVKQYLDGLEWKAKFTTDAGKKTEEEDSIYYLTPEGSSLRLRFHDNPTKIEQVVQYFMEICEFENPDGSGVSSDPHIGWPLDEYLTPEFKALQLKVWQGGEEISGDYVSKIRFYPLSNGSRMIGKLPPETFHHSGHNVKKIF